MGILAPSEFAVLSNTPNSRFEISSVNVINPS